ncbi:MAG: 3-deoxy-D-manno-octulosonic acid transferase, partial [Planctomycetota bacterium]
AMIIVLPYYLFRFATSAYYRAGLLQRFGFIKSVESVATVWLHGASIGEINACEKLIPLLRAQLPNYQLVISTLTPSAQALVKRKYPDIRSFFFPLDLSCICNKALKRVNPKLVILMEQEFWPNFILACGRRNIPMILLNGRITEHTLARYNILRWLFKPVLNRLKYLCIQNEDYRIRFEALGVVPIKIQVTGNMKYDSLGLPLLAGLPAGLSEPDKTRDYYRNLYQVKPDELVIIGGSTHAPEEEMLLDAYIKLKPEFNNIRLILAPRHTFRFDEVEGIIKARRLEFVRHSHLMEIAPISGTACGLATTHQGGSRNDSRVEVILLDTMGELAKVYAAGDVVFVGGSLVDKGGQSILEPASLGKPIIAGPSMYNFSIPSKALQDAGGLRTVNNPEELYRALKDIISNPNIRTDMGRNARQAIADHQGATARNMEFILRQLEPRPKAG